MTAFPAPDGFVQIRAWARTGLKAVAAALCWALLATTATASEPDALITGSLPRGSQHALDGSWFSGRHEASPGRLIVLGFAGDLGFSGKDQPLSAAGAVRHGRVIAWEELVSGVAPLLQADASFANLETVVTDRADLQAVDKAFNFMASPAGLRAAVEAGITVITAANNHAADFGEAGIAETHRHLQAAQAFGLKGFAGLGKGDERYRADVFDLQGTTVGVAAVGKGINPAGPAGYGQPLYASPSDFARTSAALGATEADVRVLSVHYGEELNLLPAASDRKRLRAAIDRGEATIVFGHHAHVASGVEQRGDAVIFYGLGNFLHAGTQDMARYGQCRDFGLHAKVYLWVAPGQKPVLRAVEITPIRDMQEIARPFAPEEAASRIAVVNALGEEAARDGGVPMRFAPTETGSGLYCRPGSADYGDELAARCRSVTRPLLSVATAPGMSLSACKTLPQVRLATGQPKAKPAVKGEDKAVKTAAQPGKKAKDSKVASAGKAKAKPARKFFLFSRAD